MPEFDDYGSKVKEPQKHVDLVTPDCTKKKALLQQLLCITNRSPFSQIIYPFILNARKLRLNLWIIEGVEKMTKQEMQILYMGSDLSRYYLED